LEAGFPQRSGPKKPSVPRLIYRCMKNLKPFKVNEGDWWDNDPSAPWNQPDPPEPTARIEYTEAQMGFKILVVASDSAIMRKKSDGSMWVLDVTDISDYEEFEDYLYYYDMYDERERYEGMEEEEYGAIATDLFKENKWTEGKEAWEDRGGEMRLFKIDLGLAEELIHDFVKYSKPRAGATWRPKPEQMKANRLGASILSKAFPEAED
jgi:hypothetical protein